MIRNFIFNFANFCVIVNFLTKLLTLSISILTSERAVAEVKLGMLGFSALISFTLTLRETLKAYPRFFL